MFTEVSASAVVITWEAVAWASCTADEQSDVVTEALVMAGLGIGSCEGDDVLSVVDSNNTMASLGSVSVLISSEEKLFLGCDACMC